MQEHPVLQSKSEINQARETLKQRNLSFVESDFVRTLRQYKLLPGVSVGHDIKSWDILKTVSYIESNIGKQDSVLDIGAYASEILCILHRLGYTNLTGIDLNLKVKNMPFAKSVCYEVGDMLHTPFSEGAFSAITAISVIEHGFDSDKLLHEISRLLKPEGVFIVSFDYWPNKIDTSNERMFDMDWRIFSKDEVNQFLKDAERFQLFPESNTNFDIQVPAISWANRQYTFAWLALKKR